MAEELHAGIMTAVKDKGIEYTKDQKLELLITLYLEEPHIRFHDVDNRLKTSWIPFRDAWEEAKQNNNLNDSYQMIVRYTKSQLRKRSRQSKVTA